MSIDGLDLIRVPAGTFLMGSPKGAGHADARPQREVRLPAFELSSTPITQAMYQAVTGEAPSRCPGPQLPVESVSWFEAVAFCNALSARAGHAAACTIEGEQVHRVEGAEGFRLPTEAEWEYACLAGEPRPDDNMALGALGWFGGYRSTPESVGLKAPNAWGFYDLLGNVSEWCADWFGPYAPAEGVLFDPRGPAAGHGRVLRGGSFVCAAVWHMAMMRGRNYPTSRDRARGFRVARCASV